MCIQACSGGRRQGVAKVRSVLGARTRLTTVNDDHTLTSHAPCVCDARLFQQAELYDFISRRLCLHDNRSVDVGLLLHACAPARTVANNLCFRIPSGQFCPLPL